MIDFIVAGSEAVAAFAVVVSVIYLAVQLRHMTRSAHSGTVHAISDALANFTAILGEDATLLELYVRGLAQDERLTAIEALQFDFLLLTLMRKLEDALLQYQEGVLRETEWHGWSSPLRLILSTPGGRRWWSDWTPFLSDEFRMYGDQLITREDFIEIGDSHPVRRAVKESLSN